MSLLVSSYDVMRPETISKFEALGGTALHSSKYHLIPSDLRHPPSTSLAPVLDGLLSPTLPTLLLCECVLVYMSPESTSALVDWFVNHFASTHEGSILGAIVYEMFGLQDAFGQVMLNNLRVFVPHSFLVAFTSIVLSRGTCPCQVRPRTPRSTHSVNVLLHTGSRSPVH